MTTERVAAPRVEHRTVELELPSPYEGWRFTARLDFPARVLMDLQSGDFETVIKAMDTVLVVDHNFPDVNGDIAASMLDVDPLDAVMTAVTTYSNHRTTLPNP